MSLLSHVDSAKTLTAARVDCEELKASELPFFQKVLHGYLTHITERADSLLPQFFGCHLLKIAGMLPVRVVVMNNLFNTKIKIHHMYDLKGSTIKRYA